ncbi:SOS response-associated peptidase [Halothermothrix orenii]|uniref:Abasic site processing protein n=1 Tax=Halothermothrix orenii (strain H 168 / OCM 544 / DSM 9562) TaxID=373903 RepID=B8CXQ5_HALOH|nr:SOS response-associated peptidase [Halothermothrix orenii]ACL70074.1 uncharacterized conserved protein [Halothermothrix orenii H 168]
MCGRYILSVDIYRIITRYGIEEAGFDFAPRAEIFPSEKAPVVTREGNKKQLRLFKWGFSPKFTRWLIINARGETIDKKPTFRESFFKRRCLIPATGFFEWKKTENGSQRYKITVNGEDIFSMAGIYDIFTDKNGVEVPCFSIITTRPNKKIKNIHNRMPVILSPESEELWLNPDREEPGILKELLRPYPGEEIEVVR